jgi:RNA polymerase sigma-70 factor (ECF subfamily)
MENHTLDMPHRVIESASARWSECLADLSVKRDQQVFLRLYDHFAPRVSAYLLRLGASGSLAEELTQETLLAVWRKASFYKPEKAAASTWIFTIARNQYIDKVRRQAVPTESSEPDFWADEAAPGPAQQADRAPLRSALKSLPAMQSQVLYKSYFEGKSHREIADDMSIPLGTVKSNIRLAFQKLRASMRPET